MKLYYERIESKKKLIFILQNEYEIFFKWLEANQKFDWLKMMKILIACFLVCCGLVISKSFPKLPEDFTAVVEYSTPMFNSTTTVAEVKINK